MMRRLVQPCSRLLGAAVMLALLAEARGAETEAPDYLRDVAPIFGTYCVGCHTADEPEGKLTLESFAGLVAGGDNGAVIVPGRADASRLIRMITGEIEPVMPPEDNERPTEAEIDVLRRWIDAGAPGPEGTAPEFPELTTPSIEPAANAQDEITSFALSRDGTRLALGKYRRVEIRDAATGDVVAMSAETPGKVNGVQFWGDGSRVVVASGIPGLYGVAILLDAADGKTVFEVKGHRDAIYDAKLSPQGDLLATCSHDRMIHLWDASTGQLARTLSGHNGAVMRLAFNADGTLLASASADGTVKIWQVATGERLDTLGQPEGGQCAVAFSPDDAWIVAAGADRQVRAWRLVSREAPRINPMVHASTAHDSTVVEVAFSPDGAKLASASEGGELVLWDVAKFAPVHRYELQPDVVTGIAFEANGEHFLVARMDGSQQRYAANFSGDADAAAAHLVSDADNQDPNDAAPREVSAEQEPNNAPDAANAIAAHASVRGVIAAAGDGGAPDVDLYQFSAKAGQQFVIEVNAARDKSPLDSHIEVLDATGRSIPRVVLQALRPSYFTFRGHDSTELADFRLHKWQDMELNEYLYANGEVSKLWMYPRGPDSGFLVYPGIEGSRIAYFGTTAVTHALNEPCYIVEPHAPDEQLIPNGLPQYTIYYENDDDGRRQLGADSRVAFTAPADGDYIVRVRDVRSLGGEDYRYELIVRPPRLDFHIKASAGDLTVGAGSGKEFSVSVERLDDFEGPIQVHVSGLPPGFHVSSPLVIEAGQNIAYGTINAAPDSVAPPEDQSPIKLTASAEIGGITVTKNAVDLGQPKLAPAPKILIRVHHKNQQSETVETVDASAPGEPPAPVELEIAPGETISAIVELVRDGNDGEITLGGDHSGRNLPHGVFIDNIGLNGLTLLAGESEREFFITAAPWVPEQSRLFHLRTEAEGGQTSWPVLLHIRRQRQASAASPAETAAATAFD